MSNLVSRGLGQPGEGALVAQGLTVSSGVTQTLRGSSSSLSSASGRLEQINVPNRGGGVSNADGPPQPFVVKYLRGRSESVSYAEGRLLKVKVLQGLAQSDSDAEGNLGRIASLSGRSASSTDQTAHVHVIRNLVGATRVGTYQYGRLGKDDDAEVLELLLMS